MQLHPSHHIGPRVEALLRLDLAVVLDGDLVVGLERGDGVFGDLGALGVSVEVEMWCVDGEAYVKPLIRVNSLT
jgi:hypothetical protein